MAVIIVRTKGVPPTLKITVKGTVWIFKREFSYFYVELVDLPYILDHGSFELWSTNVGASDVDIAWVERFGDSLPHG